MRGLETALDISSFLSSEWVAQRKFDGARLAIVYGENGRPARALTKKDHEVPLPSLDLPSLPASSIVDGEVVGGWQSALSQLRSGSVKDWQPFDLVSDLGFVERQEILAKAGFLVPQAYRVAEAWELCLSQRWEGVVIRRLDSGYHGPTFKVKPPRTFHAIASGGYLMVLDGYRPHTVGQCDIGLTGKVLVSCEGVTKKRKARACVVVGAADSTADVDISQLEGLITCD